jgi:hypothetical protein
MKLPASSADYCLATSDDNPHFIFVDIGLHTDWGSSILNWLYPVE